MIAARWADDVRRDRTYHRGPWHYINYPYKPTGQPETAQAKPAAEPNIVTASAENLAIVKGDASSADKAVALCWAKASFELATNSAYRSGAVTGSPEPPSGYLPRRRS
jgi:hypothetical protein